MTIEDFYADMRERQSRARPHLTERVMVCKFCGADVPVNNTTGVPIQNKGIRLVDSYERADGMLVEHYDLICCGRSAPFYRNHNNPDYGVWVRRTLRDESERPDGG